MDCQNCEKFEICKACDNFEVGDKLIECQMCDNCEGCDNLPATVTTGEHSRYVFYAEHAAETVIATIRLLNEMAALNDGYDFTPEIHFLHADLVEQCKVATSLAEDLGLPCYSP